MVRFAHTVLYYSPRYDAPSVISSFDMSLVHCGPVLSGTCFIEASAGQLICNETGGFTISGPTGGCDYFHCGYEFYLRNGTEPIGRNGTVCGWGEYTSGAKRAKSFSLWTCVLAVLLVLPVVVSAAPTGFSTIGYTVNTTASNFEQVDPVDWSQIGDQLSGKDVGTSVTRGRSRFTVAPADPSGLRTAHGGFSGRQGIPPFVTVYQDNVDRTGT